MKNFQQTPKQRRVMVQKAKADMQNTRNKGFQPRPAWTSKKKIGGVFFETVVIKQYESGHKGVFGFFWYPFKPFSPTPRDFRRFFD